LLIREQSIIVEFDVDGAIATLPDLLTEAAEREQAMAVVEFIAGAIEEMEPHTLQTLQRLRAALGLSPLALPDLARDPLKQDSALQDAAE
jgi:hypothetical protein